MERAPLRFIMNRDCGFVVLLDTTFNPVLYGKHISMPHIVWVILWIIYCRKIG
jgi:hypothetical protein